MINDTSAFPMKQPLSSFCKENGSSERPLYSLEAGFMVMKTAANGLTLLIGTLMSASYKNLPSSSYGFSVVDRNYIARYMFSISALTADKTLQLSLFTSSKHPTEPDSTMPTRILERFSRSIAESQLKTIVCLEIF